MMNWINFKDSAEIVKEIIPAIHTKVTVHADAAEQNDGVDIQSDSDDEGDR